MIYDRGSLLFFDTEDDYLLVTLASTNELRRMLFCQNDLVVVASATVSLTKSSLSKIYGDVIIVHLVLCRTGQLMSFAIYSDDFSSWFKPVA